jgi:AcrR family transcriptional regulator
MTLRTRDRILDGAAEAVARHGLAKLEMSDVSSTSGLSRGTLYRYFPGRQELLTAFFEREGRRFKERMLAAIAAAPPGAEQMRVAVEHATRHVREHAALQRLVETDPGLVLRGLREQFEGLKEEFRGVLAPILDEVALVHRGVVGVDQLVDWLMRLLVSAFLLPETRPDEMARGMTAVYRLLTGDVATGAGRSARNARARPKSHSAGGAGHRPAGASVKQRAKPKAPQRGETSTPRRPTRLAPAASARRRRVR